MNIKEIRSIDGYLVNFEFGDRFILQFKEYTKAFKFDRDLTETVKKIKEVEDKVKKDISYGSLADDLEYITDSIFNEAMMILKSLGVKRIKCTKKIATTSDKKIAEKAEFKKSLFSQSRRLQVSHVTFSLLTLYGLQSIAFLLTSKALLSFISNTIHSRFSFPFEAVLSCSYAPNLIESPTLQCFITCSFFSELSSLSELCLLLGIITVLNMMIKNIKAHVESAIIITNFFFIMNFLLKSTIVSLYNYLFLNYFKSLHFLSLLPTKMITSFAEATTASVSSAFTASVSFANSADISFSTDARASLLIGSE